MEEPVENQTLVTSSAFADPTFRAMFVKLRWIRVNRTPVKMEENAFQKDQTTSTERPDNYYGTNCEKSTMGFGEMSYITFPLDPNTNDMSIIFSSIKPNSLLICNFGEQGGGRSDLLQLNW